MRTNFLIALLTVLPCTAVAQRVDGERFAVSLVAAIGRSTLDIGPGRNTTFSSRGLQHLGIHVEHASANWLTTRASIGHSVRRSQFEVDQVVSRPRTNLDVRTTDAAVGLKLRISEQPFWTLYAVGELGRSIIHYAAASDAIANVKLDDLNTNAAEWSVLPGVEVSALASRRLSAAVAYRYGLTDIVKTDRGRTRQLELRVAFAVLRF